MQNWSATSKGKGEGEKGGHKGGGHETKPKSTNTRQTTAPQIQPVPTSTTQLTPQTTTPFIIEHRHTDYGVVLALILALVFVGILIIKTIRKIKDGKS